MSISNIESRPRCLFRGAGQNPFEVFTISVTNTKQFQLFKEIRLGTKFPVWVLANYCGLPYAICSCSLIGLWQNEQIHTTTNSADVIHDPVGIGVWI